MVGAPRGATLRSAAFGELSPSQLYAMLRLRVDVFVVEQACAYAELDGRDEEPGAVHVWHELDGAIVSTARLLGETDAGGVPVGRIGRIATARPARGRGLAGELIAFGIQRFAGRPVVLGAQAHLEGFYAGFGFVRSGADYDEDGIPHLPMRRPAG